MFKDAQYRYVTSSLFLTTPFFFGRKSIIVNKLDSFVKPDITNSLCLAKHRFPKQNFQQNSYERVRPTWYDSTIIWTYFFELQNIWTFKHYRFFLPHLKAVRDLHEIFDYLHQKINKLKRRNLFVTDSGILNWKESVIYL